MNFSNSHGDKSTQKAHFLRQIRDEPKLPPELIDDILEILGAQGSNEGREALARCLLVSRSFYLRARGILFAKIKTSERLFPSPGRKKTEMIDVLLEILEEDLLRNVDPLVTYVRDLRLSMFPLSTIGAASEWNAQRANLPLLLTMLPNLQSFGLEFTTSMDWNAIYEPMYVGIACTLKSSNLTALYLANIYHFSTSLVLGQCINLRDLYLENITHRPRGDFTACQDMFPSVDKYQTPWDPKSLQNLENVETNSFGDVFRRIMTVKRHTPQAAPFSHLKSFTVHFSNEDLAKEWQTLECAAASLERLTLHGIIASESFSPLP
ncbi:hypothetical protein GALMADRAFT_1112278 [Galerina marginata CBS 339.88]|uniref:F-box domain-containing protein n=1 Tax=Galerina marginata (strain CBS 339.88) TaxID=685588 RepID=A0A067TES6_GALM3|nr:hypothetical protein GALMADRAFT_1112278 [Galerina marginata CBS 339.88]